MDKYMSSKQVAAELGISAATVTRWVRTGLLKGERVGPRIIRIPGSEVEKLLSNRNL